MLDTFNEDVRRVAQLLAYDQPVDGFPPTLITMAKLYNSYAPFDMPSWELPRTRTVSGEFTAR